MHILDRLMLAMKFIFQLNDSHTAAENMLKEAIMRHLEAHDCVMYYTSQRQYYAQRIAYLSEYLGHDKHPAQPGKQDSQSPENNYEDSRNRLERKLESPEHDEEEEIELQDYDDSDFFEDIYIERAEKDYEAHIYHLK